MLVLSRRVGESIVIGDGIVVTVLDIRGDVVRVGVDAPREVKVHRQELLVELADTNRAAASASEESIAVLSKLVGGKQDDPRDHRDHRDRDEPDA